MIIRACGGRSLGTRLCYSSRDTQRRDRVVSGNHIADNTHSREGRALAAAIELNCYIHTYSSVL